MANRVPKHWGVYIFIDPCAKRLCMPDTRSLSLYVMWLHCFHLDTVNNKETDCWIDWLTQLISQLIGCLIRQHIKHVWESMGTSSSFSHFFSGGLFLWSFLINSVLLKVSEENWKVKAVCWSKAEVRGQVEGLWTSVRRDIGFGRFRWGHPEDCEKVRKITDCGHELCVPPPGRFATPFGLNWA